MVAQPLSDADAARAPAAATDAVLLALAGAVAAGLLGAGQRLSLAESCTGGLVSKLLTDLPGSSAWFESGLVTYSNQSKHALLGVSEETLGRFGSVSAPVVLEMADGLLARSPAHWVLAISGIAGPDGGSPEKPVGTVWIAFAGVTIGASASRFQFSGGRDDVRRAAAGSALKGLVGAVGGKGRMRRVAYEESVVPPSGAGRPTVEDLEAQPMLQTRAKILIADDSATNRLVLKRVLADVAADVVETRSGVEAVAAARDHDFALILLDVQMPGLDGFEAIRQLREMPRLAATPIMLMSAALTEPSHSKLGYEVGAVDYLVNKPVDPEMLRQKVRVFLDLYRSRMELMQLAAQARDENHRLNQENEQFRANREELVHRATHDALTGLPNRVLFEDRLQSAIQRCARSRTSFAVAYFDLDRFKSVNDRFGHAAGDALLSEVARRMVSNLRSSDTVARLSGDEFVMLLEGMDGAPRAELTGRKILQILRHPIDLSATSIGAPGSVEPSASVGISMYPTDATDADGLLMLADLAMYRVKQSGGCGVRLYSNGIDGRNAPPDSSSPTTVEAPPVDDLR